MLLYDFCRIHKTPRVTPATTAKVTQELWSMAHVVALSTRRRNSACMAPVPARGGRRAWRYGPLGGCA
jgi:hypothetical protein